MSARNTSVELRAELEQRMRELRSTQEQLRSLIERNADAILVVDDSGVVRFANPAAARLFHRSNDQLVNYDLGLPLVVGETTEIDIVSGGGEELMAEMRVVETEWAGEHALLAVLRDITERKRLEHERTRLLQERLAREQAEQALRDRDDFMALASHELKTPISTLSATAQLLQRQLERRGQLEPEQLHRSLERVSDQSRRLAQLVDHLLDVSRINSGKLSIMPTTMELRKLVDDIVASCQVTTTRHAISFRAPPSMEIVADPIRIQQVVTNLIDNAIKYSPEGGAIDVELFTAEDDFVGLSVRDHGIGIPPERHARLFERFYRAHSDDHVSGMGLGLFITQHIVELHGGRITIESPSTGGTRFVVLLPRNSARHVQ